MTNINPSEDKKLCEAATEGPWSWINARADKMRAGRLFAESKLVLDAQRGIPENGYEAVC